jgi:hypothetical protein
VSRLLYNYFLNSLKNNIKNQGKIRKSKVQKRKEKYEYKQIMIKLFGKSRYYLSYWFGAWFLYAFNHRDYNEVLYQKFYHTEKAVQKQAELLKDKYEKIQIKALYDKDNFLTGYMLYGKIEKVAEPLIQQPPNVINFAEYQFAKVK